MAAGDVLIETTGVPAGDITLDSAGDVLIDAAGDVIINGAVLGDLSGTHAARPAAATGNAGSLYYETDTGVTLRSNGSTWTVVEADLEALLLADLGLKTWNFSPGSLSAATMMADGTVYALRVPVVEGQVLSNIVCLCTVAGASLTLVKFGVFSTALGTLATTADVKASYATAGVKSHALSAAYTVPKSGSVFLAALAVGTTPPTLSRGISSGATPLDLVPAIAVAMSGQTDLPATIVDNTAKIGYWLAAS